MKKSKRIVVIISAAIFLFVIISSSLFIIENSEHKCTGDGCTICTMLQNAASTINNVKSSSAPANVSAYVAFAIVLSLLLTSRIFKVNSLFDLRVKLTA